MWPFQAIADSTESTDPLSALERLDALRSRIGVVRVADTTALDILGIPTAICVRVGVIEPATTVTSGKGTTAEEARLTAIAEALERYCAEPRGRTATTRARRRDLAGALDARTLILASWSRYADDQEIEWCRGVRLDDGASVWVPANAVFFPWDAAPDEQLFAAHTTGLAVGTSFEGAVRAGLLECIERDHYSRLVARLAVSADVSSDEVELAGDVGRMAEQLSARGVGVMVREIAGDFPVPTALAVVADDERAYRGCAARPDPSLAARAAILEAVQSRATYIQGARDDLRAPGDARPSPWFTSAGPKMPWRVPAHADSVTALVATVSAILGSAPIAVDLSLAESRLCAVRVLTPGAEVFAEDADRCGARCHAWLEGTP